MGQNLNAEVPQGLSGAPLGCVLRWPRDGLEDPTSHG